MPVRLGKEYYLNEHVIEMSRDLIGKVLVTSFDGQRTAGIITETEAYQMEDDKASHSYNGRRTKRTETMFQEGGVAYVYLIYGIHHLFNVVIGPQDIANAVLIRAIEPIENISLMLERRNKQKLNPQLTVGPGVLSKALGISKKWDGTALTQPDSPIWIEDHGNKIHPDNLIASPRVGIPYAEESVDWPWRFRLKTSKWIGK